MLDSRRIIILAITFGIIIASDELLNVIQIFRHGERTPVHFFPTDPYDTSYWKEGEGQLLNLGKKQMYELGQYTRERYDRFLPRWYSPKDFYASSSNKDRTYMSALTFAAGLYPPEGDQIWNDNLLWQPIAVYPDGGVLEPNCPRYIPLAEKLEQESGFLKQYAYFIPIIANYTGKNMSTFADLAYFHATLRIETLIGLSLPEWTQLYYPEPLTTISALGFSVRVSNDEIRKMYGGPFLTQILEYMDNLVEEHPSTSCKLRIWSAHDLNLINVLDSVGGYVPHICECGYAIFIELWKKNDTLVVNMWYKQGENISQIQPEGCNLDCPYTQFRGLISRYKVSEEEHEELCKLETNTAASSWNYYLDYRSILIMSFLCVIA